MVALLLSELFARGLAAGADAHRLYPVPPSITAGLIVRSADGTWYHPQPNHRGHFRTLGISHPIRTNSLGLRGPEVEADTRGWLVIGDSFTMGLQVPEEQTLSEQLRVLRGQPFWNGGVDGYNTRLAGRWYQALSAHLPLEGVILIFFHGNDWMDNARDAHLNPNLPHPAATPQADAAPPPSPASSLVAWWLHRSYLLTHIELARRRLLLTDPNVGLGLEVDALTQPRALMSSLEPTRRGLAEIQQATAAQGHRFLVASAPPMWALDADLAREVFAATGRAEARLSEHPYRQLAGLGAALGFPVCDLRPALQSVHRTAYLEFDGHWSAVGHHQVAQAISGCLDDQHAAGGWP